MNKLQELEYIRKKLMVYFKDEDKAESWINSKNPAFGDIEPAYLINRGRGHKVIKFIDACEAENNWVEKE